MWFLPCIAKEISKIQFFVPRFWPFPSKKFPTWDHFFQLLFPKDLEKVCRLYFGKLVQKKVLTVPQKVNWRVDGRMDKHTDTPTDKLTKRPTGPRGPIHWKFHDNGDTIRISWEIHRLPYEGFLFVYVHRQN